MFTADENIIIRKLVNLTKSKLALVNTATIHTHTHIYIERKRNYNQQIISNNEKNFYFNEY